MSGQGQECEDRRDRMERDGATEEKPVRVWEVTDFVDGENMMYNS
jgi:hypothetical protein